MNREGSLSGSTNFCADGLPPNSRLVDDYSSSERSPTGENDKIVFLISREKDTRVMLEILLGHWGYRVESSAHQKYSVPVIQSLSPRLILLDTILPFEVNLEIISQIRRERLLDRIPLIVLSGFSHSEHRRLSIAVGANHYFVKPLNFELLEICLKRNIDKQYKIHAEQKELCSSILT